MGNRRGSIERYSFQNFESKRFEHPAAHADAAAPFLADAAMTTNVAAHESLPVRVPLFVPLTRHPQKKL